MGAAGSSHRPAPIADFDFDSALSLAEAIERRDSEAVASLLARCVSDAERLSATSGVLRASSGSSALHLAAAHLSSAHHSAAHIESPALAIPETIHSTLVAATATTEAGTAAWADALEAVDAMGRTPLLVAVTSLRVDMVQWLLDNGADPWARDGEGRDALQLLQAPDACELAPDELDRGVKRDVRIRDVQQRLRWSTTSQTNTDAASASHTHIDDPPPPATASSYSAAASSTAHCHAATASRRRFHAHRATKPALRRAKPAAPSATAASTSSTKSAPLTTSGKMATR